MLRFSRASRHIILYWWGGVNRHLLKPSLFYALWLLIFWQYTLLNNVFVETTGESLRVIASFVVFLLVFRLNQCTARMNEGKINVSRLFSILEESITVSCTYMYGAGEVGFHHDESEHNPETLRLHADMSAIAKVNIIRLTIAYAVSLVIHIRLYGAVCNSMGELDDETLAEVTLYYMRLQGLLYAEELAVVDHAISVTCESAARQPESSPRMRTCPRPSAVLGRVESRCCSSLGWLLCGGRDDGRPIYRSCTSRLRAVSEVGPHAGPLFGDPQLSTHAGDVIGSLPQAVMLMVFDALMQPVCQPWGLPERLLVGLCGRCNDCNLLQDRLNVLISMPIPLAYLQHCHMLLFIFIIFFPIFIDPTDGIFSNVLMPLAVFWSVIGFSVLADKMENPLGKDDIDINVEEFVHSLEVHAGCVFESTHSDRATTRCALWRPVRDFGMHADDRSTSCPVAESLRSRLDFSFDDYFCWHPLPAVLLEAMMKTHGHVDSVHGAYVQAPHRSLQPLLRRSFSRRSSDLTVPSGEHPGLQSKDPNLTYFFLAFRGVHQSLRVGNLQGPSSSSRAEEERLARWALRAQQLLHKDSSASQLLCSHPLGTANDLSSFDGPCLDLSSACSECKEEMPTSTKFSAKVEEVNLHDGDPHLSPILKDVQNV